MIPSAGAASARPRRTGGQPSPHNVVVLKGFDPLPEVPAGSPESDRLGVALGSYILRLEGVGEVALESLQRAVGLVGGRCQPAEHAGGVAHIALGMQQVEALRSQLLAAPSDLLRIAEEIVAALRAYHRRDFTLRCRGKILECGPRPLLMGIVNCTPDSFYPGSRRQGADAVEEGLRMVEEGADILDVGGESTRPGSAPVDSAEEIERVLPVIEALAGKVEVPISVDTRHAAVARVAIEAGAGLVNDVSGLRHDPELAAVVAEADVPLVLMHARGKPDNMVVHANYQDVVAEVARELREAMARARSAGVSDDAIVLDPGIGFAKRAEHSLTILRHTAALRSLGRPLLVGPSRKSFVGVVLDLPTEERLEGTAAAAAAAVLYGAHILRVHDVGVMRRVVAVAAAIRSEGAGWIS